jgi:phosphohistidine phosphatase
MKSLTLFRHAKTERESPTGRDFDRRLDDRGRRDAPRIGEEIRKLDLDYDLTLASPAARAAETATLAGLMPRYDQRIYEASADDLLAIVQQADQQLGRLMLVGHNPGFERLASKLLGHDVEMPTGSLVEIKLPIDRWSEAEWGSGRLDLFLKPKLLA